DEILDRLGDEDFARSGMCCDPSTNRDGDTGRLPIDQFALSCMDAGADLDPEVPHALGDLERTANGAGRPVKGRVEAVAGSVVLDTVPARQRVTHHSMVVLDELLPGVVTEGGLLMRRTDDIGEQNGSEYSLQFRRSRFQAEERMDNRKNLLDVIGPEVARDWCDRGMRNQRTHVRA